MGWGGGGASLSLSEFYFYLCRGIYYSHISHIRISVCVFNVCETVVLILDISGTDFNVCETVVLILDISGTFFGTCAAHVPNEFVLSIRNEYSVHENV